MAQTVLLLVLLLFGCSSFPRLHTLKINQRPIIGILAQETFDAGLLRYGKTYIAAPYVKYLESAGCRVVPVRLNLTNDEYEKIFYSINGIIFPGGSSDLKTSAFAKAAKKFYELALKAFDAGDYFPIWGTCLGLQLLSVLTAGKNLLTNTDSENIALALNLTNAAASSKMFQKFPPDVYQALCNEPLTGNFHSFSISVKAFLEDEKLSKFYSILSTNNDRKGVEFVSTMEGILYPFYGVQWHPEVNRFQWQRNLAFPHSPNAVKVSYFLSDFFVNEARKNFHHFKSLAEEEATLIYNYSPRYVPTSSYIQVYFF
ncbi:gamma-glutamyl hydrolase isoform X1 [Carcharodon carcharias]|uniref:gamma-glutamyl hydrolase isoform X1 n=1 Tax=Carcharodon carcharias TaxID=13397 RepID=UPI001B7DBD3A|nr:gamma-glutamyl hydrolase isoform X1 [Carcharodon carcharias]